MQPIVEWGWRKTDHLWELAGGYERSVRFSDHKYTVKGETADVGGACVSPMPRIDLTG